jgi:hypothetical protein
LNKTIQKADSTHRKLRNVAEAMPNNVPSTVRRFLDIKAQVGDKEDNDAYGDNGLPGESTLVFSMSAPLTSVCILDDFIDDQDCGQPEDTTAS